MEVVGERAGKDETAEESTTDYDLRDIITSEYVLATCNPFYLHNSPAARWKNRWYIDHRTWKLRRDSLNQNWAPLMEALADAYLEWRHPSTPRTEATPSPYDFTIDVVDIYELTQAAFITRSEDSSSAAIALVQAGFLGTSPHSPSLAISLKTLELFRVIRLHRPSFSVEAFAKTICYLYSVSK